MIERFINNRMYRINQQPDGKWQVRGYEEYNAIVGLYMLRLMRYTYLINIMRSVTF